MARYGLRPSKPHAVLVAVLSTAMVTFGLVQSLRSGGFQWFMVLWAAIGLTIAGLALRQGFSRKGRAARVDVDENGNRTGGAHHLWGMTTDREDSDARYRVRPSKKAAVLSAIGGVAIIVLGVLKIPGPFVILWVAFAVAVIGFNLWSAFGRKGATSVLERRD